MAKTNIMPIAMLGVTWRGSPHRTPEPPSYFQLHCLNQFRQLTGALADESPLATPGGELWT